MSAGKRKSNNKQTSTASAKTRARYHHGELPAVIMALALKHIQSAGTEKLSLRALAREAGVSQTAPYRHFPNKDSLLAALATQGFNELRQRVEVIVDSDEAIADRFMQMGVSYIEFAIENPTTYHLMFGSVLTDFAKYDDLHRASRNAYAVVQRCEAELLTEKQHSVDRVRFGGVIWAGVHGISSLLLMNHQAGRTDTKAAIEAMRGDIQDSLMIMFGHLIA